MSKLSRIEEVWRVLKTLDAENVKLVAEGERMAAKLTSMDEIPQTHRLWSDALTELNNTIREYKAELSALDPPRPRNFTISQKE